MVFLLYLVVQTRLKNDESAMLSHAKQLICNTHDSVPPQSLKDTGTTLRSNAQMPKTAKHLLKLK
jgi:hypothetical protein